jgi:hypothetical protein
MTDLWEHVDHDPEAEVRQGQFAAARSATAHLVPFVAAATDTADFEHRLNLVADKLDAAAVAVVGDHDPAGFAVIRDQLTAALQWDHSGMNRAESGASDEDRKKTERDRYLDDDEDDLPNGYDDLNEGRHGSKVAGAREVWQQQVAQIEAQIPPEAIVDFGDGTKGIDPSWATANPSLAATYRGLLSAGYANGYVASHKTAATDYEDIDAAWNRSYWSGQAEQARRWEEAEKRIRSIKGKEIEVVKGRKIPLGTRGTVFWVGESKYGGYRVGFTDAEGNEYWTDYNNVDEVGVTTASKTASSDGILYAEWSERSKNRLAPSASDPRGASLPVGSRVMVYGSNGAVEGKVLYGPYVTAIETMAGGNSAVYDVLVGNEVITRSALIVVSKDAFDKAWHVYNGAGEIIAGGPSISRERADQIASENGGIVRQGSSKTASFLCQNCGSVSESDLDKCPECGEYDYVPSVTCSRCGGTGRGLGQGYRCRACNGSGQRKASKTAGIMDWYEVVVLRRGDEAGMVEAASGDVDAMVERATALLGDPEVVSVHIINRHEPKLNGVVWSDGQWRGDYADGYRPQASRQVLADYFVPERNPFMDPSPTAPLPDTPGTPDELLDGPIQPERVVSPHTTKPRGGGGAPTGTEQPGESSTDPGEDSDDLTERVSSRTAQVDVYTVIITHDDGTRTRMSTAVIPDALRAAQTARGAAGVTGVAVYDSDMELIWKDGEDVAPVTPAHVDRHLPDPIRHTLPFPWWSSQVAASKMDFLRTAADEYNSRVTRVTLKDGTVISDVMGSDPDPAAPGGVRYVGFDANGARRTWTSDEVASVDDAQYDKAESWVDEQMRRQYARTAAAPGEVTDFLARIEPELRARIEPLRDALVYGPRYNRNVTENVFTAARMRGDDREWFLRKAEAQYRFYNGDGQWVEPVHPRSPKQQTFFSSSKPVVPARPRSAKVDEVVRGLLASNPGLDPRAARRMAVEVVVRYPAMVKGN